MLMPCPMLDLGQAVIMSGHQMSFNWYVFCPQASPLIRVLVTNFSTGRRQLRHVLLRTTCHRKEASLRGSSHIEKDPRAIQTSREALSLSYKVRHRLHVHRYDSHPDLSTASVVPSIPTASKTRTALGTYSTKSTATAYTMPQTAVPTHTATTRPPSCSKPSTQKTE